MGDEELPRSMIALDALKDVREVLDGHAGSEWSHTTPTQDVDHVLHMAYARLRMAGMRRDRRSARWLGKVTSFSFPRWIARTPGKDASPYVCFTIEISDGAKVALDRAVEVRMSLAEAEDFARQVASMTALLKKKQGNAQTPADGPELGKLLPNDQ